MKRGLDLKKNLFIAFFVFFFYEKVSLAKIYINISVDWEGRNISEQNIKAMEEFRKDYPRVPLLHFLNAAYFTKKSANKETLKNQIKRVLKKGDEHGLHIHSWKSLVEKAGVSYLSKPSWDSWGSHDDSCLGDCGHSVPLWAYTEAELRKIIRLSLEILEKNGFKRATSFRAGGWMSSKKVLEALSAEGISLDASAVPREFLESSQPIITSWIDRIWPRTKTTSQPYFVSLKDKERKILEFPNNGCLADYMTGRMVLSVFKENVKEWLRNPEKDIFVSFGFHQETASYYLPQLRRGIELIEAYAEALKAPLSYTVNPLEQIL